MSVGDVQDVLLRGAGGAEQQNNLNTSPWLRSNSIKQHIFYPHEEEQEQDYCISAKT